MFRDENVQKVDRSLFGDTPIPSINMMEVITTINNQRIKISQPLLSSDIKSWLLNIGKGFACKQKGIEVNLVDDFNNLHSLIKLHDEYGYTSKSTIEEISIFSKHKEELKEEFKTSFTPSNVKDLKDSIHKIQSIQTRLKEQMVNYAIVCDRNFWFKIINKAIQIIQNEIDHNGHITEKIINYTEYQSLESTEQITKEEIQLRKKHELKPIKDYQQRMGVLILLRKIITIKNEWISHGRFADYASDRLLTLYQYNILPRKDDLELLENKLKAEKKTGALARQENFDIYLICLDHIKKARRELRAIEIQLLASMTARLEAAEQFGDLQFDDLSWAIFYKLPNEVITDRPLYTTAVELYLGPNTPKRIKLRTGLTSVIAEGFHQCIEDAAEAANQTMDKIRLKQQKKIYSKTNSLTSYDLIEDHQFNWIDALNIRNMLKRINRLDMFRVPNELTLEYKTPELIDEMDIRSRTDYQARNRLFHNPTIRYALNIGPSNLRRFSQEQQIARNNFTFENITDDGKALWLESAKLWIEKSKNEFRLLKESVAEPSHELKLLQDHIEGELASLSNALDVLQKSESKFVMDKCIDEINEVLKRTYIEETDVIQLVKNINRAKLFINNVYSNPHDTYLPQLDIMEAIAKEITNRLREHQYDDAFIQNCMQLLHHIHPDRNQTGLGPERSKELFLMLTRLKSEYDMYIRSKPNNILAFADKVLYFLRPTINLSKAQLLIEASRCTEEKSENWLPMIPLKDDATKKIPLGFQQYYTKKLKKGIKLAFFQNQNRVTLIDDIVKLSRLISSSLDSKIEIKEHLNVEAPLQAINLLSEEITHDIQTVRDSLIQSGFDNELKAKKKCACIYKSISHRHAYLLQLAWINTLHGLLDKLDKSHNKIIDNILHKKNIKHFVLDEKGINLERVSSMSAFIIKNTKGIQLLEKQTLLHEIVQKKAVDELKILLLRLENKEPDIYYPIHRWQSIVNFLLKNNDCYNIFLQELRAPINQVIFKYDGTSAELLNLLSIVMVQGTSQCADTSFDPIVILCEKRFRYVMSNVANHYQAGDIEFLETHAHNQNVTRKLNEIILHFIEDKQKINQWDKATAQFIESHGTDFATYSYRLIGVNSLLNLSPDKKAMMDKPKCESLIKDILTQARSDRAIPPLIPSTDKQHVAELQAIIEAHLNEPWSHVNDAIINQFATLEQKQQWNFNWATHVLKMPQHQMKFLDKFHPLITLKNKLMGQQNVVYFYIDYFGAENLKKLYYQIKNATVASMKEMIKPINLSILEEKHAELEPETEDMRLNLLQMNLTGSEFYNLFSNRELCNYLEVEPLQEQIIKDRSRLLLSARNFNVAVKNIFILLKNAPEQVAATVREDTRLFVMRRSQRNLLIDGNRQLVASDSETKQTDIYDYEYEENPDLFFYYYKQPIILLCLNELNILTQNLESALSQNIAPAEYNTALQPWVSTDLIKEICILPLEWVTYSVYNEIKIVANKLETAFNVVQIKYKLGELIYNLLNKNNFKPDFNFQCLAIDAFKKETSLNGIWHKLLDSLIDAYQLAVNRYIYKTTSNIQLSKNTKSQFAYAVDNVYLNLTIVQNLVELIGTQDQQRLFYKLQCVHFHHKIIATLKSLPFTSFDEVKSLTACFKMFVNDNISLEIKENLTDPEYVRKFGYVFFDATMRYFRKFGDTDQQNNLMNNFVAAYKENHGLRQVKNKQINVVRILAFSAVKQILASHGMDELTLETAANTFLEIIETRDYFSRSIEENSPIASHEIEQFTIAYTKMVRFDFLFELNDKQQMISLATSILSYSLQRLKVVTDLDSKLRYDAIILLFLNLVSAEYFEMTLYQAKEIWCHSAMRINDPTIHPPHKKAHEEMMNKLIKFILEYPIYSENLNAAKIMIGETVTLLARQTPSTSAFLSSSVLFSSQGSHYMTSPIEYAINRIRIAIILKEIENYLKHHNIKLEIFTSCKLSLLQTTDESKSSEFSFKERSDMNFERIGRSLGITDKCLMRKLYSLLEIYTSASQALESTHTHLTDKVRSTIDEVHQDFEIRKEIYAPHTKYLEKLIECKTVINKPIIDLCQEWHIKSSKKSTFIGTLRIKAST